MAHYGGKERLRLGRRGWFWLLTAVFSLSAGVLGCTEKQVILPGVTNSSGLSRHEGKFIWFDLFTTDLGGACDFYGGLFGWSFEDTAPGDSNIKTISNSGAPIGNAVQIKFEGGRNKDSRWISFMSFADVDQAVGRIAEKGGSVYIPPKEVPNRGRLALVHDPEGASFGVLTATKGDPPDGPYVANGWIGSELWTRNINESLVFYGYLAGYQPETRKVGGALDYLLLFRDGQPRGGMVKIPWKEGKSNWVPYVGVGDIEAVVKKAEKLGGKVLIGLDPDREDDVAILADPSGAVFGVQQLQDHVNRGGNPS